MRLLLSASLLLLLSSALTQAEDAKEIVGVWKGQMPKDTPGSIELTITPTHISGRNPITGKSLGEGPYELDAAKGTLDATRSVNFGRGKKYVGVYTLSGKTLKWCATSRKARPADLTHRPGQDAYLMVLERQR